VDHGGESFGIELATLLSSTESFHIPELFTEVRNGIKFHNLAAFDIDLMVSIENGRIICHEPPIVIMSASSPSAVTRSLFEIAIPTQEHLSQSMVETIIMRWFPLDWNRPDFQSLAKKAIERLLVSRQFGYNMTLHALLDEIYVDHTEGRLRKFLPRAYKNAPSAFLSYRRADSSAKALILKIRELCLEAGFKSVFVDVQRDSIPLGISYDDVIQEAIESADVFFVVIGDQWARILEERRNDTLDPVTWEIQIALGR
jgi:hypothetical protein